MSIILISFLITAACYNDGFQKALFFYDGSCDEGSVSQVNTALHLLINVFSTLVVRSPPLSHTSTPTNLYYTVGKFYYSHTMVLSITSSTTRSFKTLISFHKYLPHIKSFLRPSFVSLFKVLKTIPLIRNNRLASSNFFMQVLNSFSREEINTAHLKGSWLEIGIPSIQNIPHVSKFKTWCWMILLISSIPIHLLFNSAIFEMDHRESSFSLTIASEEFSKRGSYYPVGASLLLPGNNFSSIYFEKTLEQYSDETSNIVQSISAIAVNSHEWERLQTMECQQEYLSCSGLRRHRNIVVVAEKPGGWIRDGTLECLFFFHSLNA